MPALVEALWRVQTAVQAIAARAGSIPGLSVPEGWNPFVDTDLLDRQVAVAAPGRRRRRRLLALPRRAAPADRAGLPAGPAAHDAVARLRDGVVAMLDVCESSPGQLSAWAGDDGFVLRWSMTRPERGVGQPGADARCAAGSPSSTPSSRCATPGCSTRAGCWSPALYGPTTPSAPSTAGSPRRRWPSGWTRPASTCSTPQAHEKAIRRFTTASRAVREHLTAALPARGARRRGRSTRRRAPARSARCSGSWPSSAAGSASGQLLAQYGELITQVMPCVLVSPDSVARFFPAAAGQFDLVVFDEASQIRVADAVGALGRARAAVVVGDSKQMPPTSFAEPSSGGDESTDFPETTVEDEESILSECVQARVPRQWLSWHYRSQDESLIAFSNNQYYENRLSSFPAPTHGRASAEPDGRGVSLVRVPGTFHRSNAGRLLRTNPIEAKAIVAEIRRRFDLVPKYGDGSDVVPSIGVVTFNAQQRAYIEALLRDADDDRLAAALDRADGEGLFVKNLENVQGDERDVVFFSTGFSPNANGDLPLNFGPLNRVGGERRLNVAITRARRQVVVFSSFDPEQLRAEETSSIGIKHLRAYLDLAAQGTDVLPRDARSASVVDRHREDDRRGAARARARRAHRRRAVGVPGRPVDLSTCRSGDTGDGRAAGRARVGAPPHRRRPRRAAGRGAQRDAALAGGRAGVAAVVAGRPGRASSTTWSRRWTRCRVGAVPEPIAFPTAAVESFKGVAALRSAVTSVAVPAPARSRSAGAKPAGPVAMDGETAFVPWIPKVAGEKSVLDELPTAKAARAVRKVLTAGIKAEGPIHVDRLTKLTVGAFGLTRSSEARKQALLSTLPPSAVVDDGAAKPAAKGGGCAQAGRPRRRWTARRRSCRGSPRRPVRSRCSTSCRRRRRRGWCAG